MYRYVLNHQRRPLCTRAMPTRRAFRAPRWFGADAKKLATEAVLA